MGIDTSIRVKPTVDHVFITVNEELNAAADTYKQLGFTLTDRGHHSLGSSNNLAVFGSTYLELLGFEPGNHRDDLWDYPIGLSGLAFKPTNDDDFTEPLRRNGATLSPIKSFSRPVKYHGGQGVARFRTASVIDNQITNGQVFFCQHLTPDLVWRKEWQTHANGTLDVDELYIVAKDPLATLSIYERLFGDNISSAVDGGVSIPAGQATIFLLTSIAVNKIFDGAEAISKDGSDRPVALGLRTLRLALAKGALEAGGVKFKQGNDRIIVPASEAFGVALSFSD